MKNPIQKSLVAIFCDGNDLNTFNEIFFVNPKHYREVKILIFSFDYKNLRIISEPQTSVQFYEFFLIDSGNSIDLSTIELYTNKMCKSPQHVLINSFDKRSQKWKKPLRNYQKFLNFHGCLRVFECRFAITCYPEEIDYETRLRISMDPNVLEILSKIVPNAGKLNYKHDFLVKILAEKGNFTPHYQMSAGENFFIKKFKLSRYDFNFYFWNLFKLLKLWNAIKI